MNTLNYIGCKQTLFDTIESIVQKHIPDLKSKSFSDLFMGTGVVSFRMLDRCRSIHANDLEYYSYLIGCALLKVNYTPRLQQLIDQCNQLPGVKGLIYTHYSYHDACERMFFTEENAQKTDVIRQQLEAWLLSEHITREEYHFLLASLLVSVDKVANTACVYGAYLKRFKTASLKPLTLSPIHTKTDIRVEDHHVTQEFAEKVEVKSDVVYLDPPYNQRSYSSNYFVLNYIARYDETIEPRGKTGTIDRNQSGFSSKARIKEVFQELLEKIQAEYIVLSYNNEGLLTEDELRELLRKKGLVTLYKIKYNKFKAQKNVNGDHVYEYLWVVHTEEFGRPEEITVE